MLLPGLCGEVVCLPLDSPGDNTDSGDGEACEARSRGGVQESVPLADALLFEPIPYRSAIAEGATHVLVLRTRPDSVNVVRKQSVSFC